MKNNGITIIVSGSAGVGKSTIATLIHRYLKSLGFTASIKLADNEMPRCPSDLRKSIASLLDQKTPMRIVEKQTTRDGKLKGKI